MKYYLRFCNLSSENVESSVCLILLDFSCDDAADVLSWCFFFFFLPWFDSCLDENSGLDLPGAAQL